MTYLLIHPSIRVQTAYLVKFSSEVMGKSFNELDELLVDPDIHYIDLSENITIKLEDAKQLLKEMIYKPFGGSHQIGIFFHSQMLTIEAQNALLKTLEEQSDYSSYILLLNNENSLLPTIRSRSSKIFIRESNNESFGSLEAARGFKNIEIATLNLVEQIKFAEGLVKLDKEEKGAVEKQLNEILTELQYDLRVALENNHGELPKIQKQIEIVQVSIERYRANVNKRLLLENLFVQLSQL